MLKARSDRMPILVSATDTRYLHVMGGAGTGKTWFAFDYAKAVLARNPGLKVLFVCYTKALAAYLSNKATDDRIEGLNIASIDSIFSTMRVDSGMRNRTVAPEVRPRAFASSVDWQNLPRDNESAKRIVAEKRFEALGATPYEIGYDCLIVDEGQDLCQQDYGFLMALTRQNKDLVGYPRVLVCSGNEQNILGGTIDLKGEWFNSALKFDEHNELTLKYNLRNSGSIHHYCKRIARDNVTKSGFAYKGPEYDVRTDSLECVLKELLEVEGLLPSDIAVLSDVVPKKEDLQAFPSKPLVLSSGDDAMTLQNKLQAWQKPGGKSVLVSTVKAFKGLEANCVVVNLMNPRTSTEEIYVACTRARFRLIVMPNETGLPVDRPAEFARSGKGGV